jgi:RNA recognition motif-containing protein
MAGAKLFVGNLNWSVNSERLREIFFEYGTVQSANEGKGFGFVEMSSQQEAEEARKALNGTQLNGQVAQRRPCKATSKRERQARRRSRKILRGEVSWIFVSKMVTSKKR